MTVWSSDEVLHMQKTFQLIKNECISTYDFTRVWFRPGCGRGPLSPAGLAAWASWLGCGGEARSTPNTSCTRLHPCRPPPRCGPPSLKHAR